jgi:type I restriction enzyme S subunit
MSYSPYSSYKDSGVEWLGQVPQHWMVAPFKKLIDIQNGADHKHVLADHGYPVIGSGGAFAFASDYIYDGESVLLGRKGTIDKPLHILGKFWTVDTMYWSKIEPGNCGKFSYYTALTIPFDYYSTNTALPSMTKSALGMHTVVQPPYAEQCAIAGFLDRETTKIDDLIHAQERLVELLMEKRRSIITNAVTKGLDPVAIVKASGVEWLGDIPAHWSVCLLKRAFRSIDYGISESLEAEGDVAILRMGNIQDGSVVLDDVKYVEIVDSTLLLDKGDLLYNRTNSIDLVGKVGMFKGGDIDGRPVSFASYLVRLRVASGCIPEYFSYLLNTDGILGLVRASAFVAIGQCNLNPTRYGETMVGIPPEVEQVAIVAHLDTETRIIEDLIEKSRRVIGLFKERRGALISAAVTGKIDVRELA